MAEGIAWTRHLKIDIDGRTFFNAGSSPGIQQSCGDGEIVMQVSKQIRWGEREQALAQKLLWASIHSRFPLIWKLLEMESTRSVKPWASLILCLQDLSVSDESVE
jgi:hypothetical protein